MRAGQTNDRFDELEAQLMTSLRPVQPSREFVDHLYSRLTTPVGLSIEPRSNALYSLMLLAFSLVSGVALVWVMRHFRSASA